MKRFAACLMTIAAVGAATDVFVVTAPTASAQDKPAPKKPDDKAPPKDEKKDEKKPDEKKGEASAWMDNYEKALALAKKEKKFVMADFTGSDWCPPCKALRADVFDQKEFLEWAKKNDVLLEVDQPKQKKLPDDVKKQNDELATKHNIKSVPTVIFFNEKGDVVGRQEGLKPGTTPASWIKEATELLAKAKK